MPSSLDPLEMTTLGEMLWRVLEMALLIIQKIPLKTTWKKKRRLRKLIKKLSPDRNWLNKLWSNNRRRRLRKLNKSWKT